MPSAAAKPRGNADARIGIVHFGPGAFHRSHQAAYVDALLEHDPRWGIAAVSINSGGTVAALAQQDGLYTLAIRDADPRYQIIGAHHRFLGPADAAATSALLADPAVTLVSMTVTEKGYCLAPDGTLDFNHPAIVHDLALPVAPASLIGWVVAGLDARRSAGTAPFTVISCDNLAENGAKLKSALIALARTRDRALADWIEGEVSVPNTVVDSITPAADQRLAADVATVLGGVVDDIPVQREAYAQWVIQDTGRSIGPDLASVGATVTGDIAGYERAKLRILNGAHSTLAYAGLLRGRADVAAAMNDGVLASFVRRMIAYDIVPTLSPVAGLDFAAYTHDVERRFRNPAIVHRLEQIAHDGSHKLLPRLGETLVANRATGRLPGELLSAFGCWVAFLIVRARSGIPIVDPASATLADIVLNSDPQSIPAALANRGLGLPASVSGDEPVLAAVAEAMTRALANDWTLLNARQ